MIQDIEPYKFDNQYKPIPADKNSFLLYYQERSALIAREGDVIRFPRFADVEPENDHLYEEATYLFAMDEDRYYLVNDLANLPEGFEMADISVFRTAVPRQLAFAGITGYSLWNWYQSRKYCGKCATPLEHHHKERMLHCPSCKQTEYPRISPAVIVGVINGDKILLTRYANRPYTNYALLAGFTEIGETIEQTVQREVMEEVGIKVKNIRYYKSQPWAFTDCLLLGYFADLDGDETITMDKEELAAAEWVSRENVPPAELHISLTSEMMEQFRTGKI